jgi:hypothetical protein
MTTGARRRLGGPADAGEWRIYRAREKAILAKVDKSLPLCPFSELSPGVSGPVDWRAQPTHPRSTGEAAAQTTHAPRAWLGKTSSG